MILTRFFPCCAPQNGTGPSGASELDKAMVRGGDKVGNQRTLGMDGKAEIKTKVALKPFILSKRYRLLDRTDAFCSCPKLCFLHEITNNRRYTTKLKVNECYFDKFLLEIA